MGTAVLRNATRACLRRVRLAQRLLGFDNPLSVMLSLDRASLYHDQIKPLPQALRDGFHFGAVLCAMKPPFFPLSFDIVGDLYITGRADAILTGQSAMPTPKQSSQLPSSGMNSTTPHFAAVHSYTLATQPNTRMGLLIKREPGSDEDHSSDSNSEPVPRSQRKRTTFLDNNKSKSQKKVVSSQGGKKTSAVKEESEGSSEEIPIRQRGPPVTPKSKPSRSRRKVAPEASNETPPANRRQTRASERSRRHRNAVVSSTDSDSEGIQVAGDPSSRAQAPPSAFGEPESSGDDALASSPGRKSRKRKVPEVHSGDEESEDDLPISSRKRKVPRPALSDSEDEPVTQGRRERSPSAIRQEQEDLAEDLEFLGSSPRKLTNASRRQKSVPQAMNARQRALEALKRRRAGEKEASPDLEEQPEQKRRRALYDTDSSSESSQEDEEDEDEDDEDSDNQRSTVPQGTTLDMFQEDDDDQNFVVEDEDDTIGVPDEDAKVPLAFTTMGRAKGKDLFKFAVDWMVQNKLNPAFPNRDEIYDLAFRKLDDEVQGLVGSKFVSSAWTGEFTRALNARPDIEVSEIGGASRLMLEDHCGACNRRGHPATWDIRFSGHAYHKDTLEEVDNSSDSDDSDDDDDDDDHVSYDAKGNPIPSADTVFHVGVFCKANAETAHALMHWRYHLNGWVVDYLRAQGHLEPAKIVERDGWKTKKRTKYANEVVDEMLHNGEIKRLHRDFRTNIDHARSAKVSVELIFLPLASN